MTENLLAANIGEIVVSGSDDDVLVAYGLGSCVAICLYDPQVSVAGMIHALLPEAPKRNGVHIVEGKFVDRGLPLLLDEIEALGARRRRLKVRLCGGANMLIAPGFDGTPNIGERNIAMAESMLSVIGLKIQAQATGGNAGRTVKMWVSDGQVTVKTLGRGEKPL